MRKLIPFLLLLLLAVSVQGQKKSQRVTYTTDNPPTTCVPGKLVTNSGLLVKKVWLGLADGSCFRIDGGAAVAGSGTVNTIPKFTAGTTLGDSRITDAGAGGTISSDVDSSSFIINSTLYRLFVAGNNGIVTFGDYNGDVNGTVVSVDDPNKTITATASTESVTIDGATHVITGYAGTDNHAALRLNGSSGISQLGDVTENSNGTLLNIDDPNRTIQLFSNAYTNTAATSISNVTALWGAGSDGTKLQINGDGYIVNYHGGTPGNGELLIGNGSLFENGVLTQGAGISIINGAGSITIASNTLSGTTASINPGALLAGACGSATVSITGATTSMAVVATPATYPGDAVAWKAYVSSANVVTVKVCAIVAATPTASVYNVRVIQ